MTERQILATWRAGYPQIISGTPPKAEPKHVAEPVLVDASELVGVTA